MRRLLLFDIDGTLVCGGPAKEAFHEALLDVFGTAGPIVEWEFSGKTDPQIARELLTEAGLDRHRIDTGFPELWDRYLKGMEEKLPGVPTRALQGVVDLLVRLESEADVAVGLLTGNVLRGARLKLSSAGVEFPFAIGAYGSDHEVRNELPAIAMRRAQDHWGVSFSSREVIVVGDTPRDVDCGRHHGTRTVAVATGQFDEAALLEAGADVVLPDLGDTDRAMRALLD